MELSVGGGSNGVHTLVVFSDAWIAGSDYINPFLSTAFAGKSPSEYEHENGRTTQGLLEIIKRLENNHKDFFLVFAHVEQNSGLWTEVGGGRLEEWGKDEFFRRRTLGFQKVITHDKPDSPCRKKVKTWLQDGYPALILFVLSQRDNDVVIIDQPEDDLDNQTIYADVNKRVKQLKPMTQFIFATHNANIPVLGDAEQVLACHYQDNNISVECGSIDKPAIQQHIVNSMEGGEEAFRQRKKMYELWKPLSY